MELRKNDFTIARKYHNRAEMKALLSKEIAWDINHMIDPTIEENFNELLNKAMHLQRNGCWIIGMWVKCATKVKTPDGFSCDISRFALPIGIELDYTYYTGG